MPNYDFTCIDGHAFEAYVARYGSPPPPCKVCGKESRRCDVHKPSYTGDNISQSSIRFHLNYTED